MNNALHAKALRAAEWAKANNYQVNHFPKAGNMKGDNWSIRSNGMDVNFQKRMESDEFIRYCEDLGWQDTPEPKTFDAIVGKLELTDEECAEDEGVEWNEWITVQDGNFTVSVNNKTEGPGYAWDIWCNRSSNMIDSGEEPTRAKARKAAIKAARGLG